MPGQRRTERRASAVRGQVNLLGGGGPGGAADPLCLDGPAQLLLAVVVGQSGGDGGIHVVLLDQCVVSTVGVRPAGPHRENTSDFPARGTLGSLLHEHGAPEEQYERLGLTTDRIRGRAARQPAHKLRTTDSRTA